VAYMTWAVLGYTTTAAMLAVAVWALVRRSSHALAVLLVLSVADVAAWALARVPGWSILNVVWGGLVFAAATVLLWTRRRP
jgi:hypothetical protein